jgi:hypothetical protein
MTAGLVDLEYRTLTCAEQLVDVWRDGYRRAPTWTDDEAAASAAAFSRALDDLERAVFTLRRARARHRREHPTSRPTP